MEDEKFKVGTRCFVECVISETKGRGDFPIVCCEANGESGMFLYYTNDGRISKETTAPSLFTADEVAAKLHPDLVAEIERLRVENEYLKANSKVQMQSDEVFLQISGQVEALTAEKVELLSKIEQLETQNESLLAENKALKIKKQYSEIVDAIRKDAFSKISAQVESLQAEKENLASRINELETIDNGVAEKLELAELKIAEMNEAHGFEVKKLNAQIQRLVGIIIKATKQ